jgi:hypothetical protein
MCHAAPLSTSSSRVIDKVLETMFYQHHQVHARSSSEAVPVASPSRPRPASGRLLSDGVHDASENWRKNMGGGRGLVRQRSQEPAPSRLVTIRAR